ncbi:MAG: DUF4783 domain-containing protein [Bacteroidota bacterium]
MIQFINIVPAIIIAFITLLTVEQDQARIPEGISIAFKAGNAAELSKYMNATVGILLLDKEDFYKKNAAEAVLNDFFTTYRTRDFIIRHQGAKSDAQYAIGILKTERGDFRVYFLLKKVDSELLIHTIRIEAENGK